MQPGEARQEASTERVLVGYLVSVTFGTVVFVLSVVLGRVTSFESATNNSHWVKAAHFSIMLMLIFGLSWMFAVGVTALPCAALSWTARKFKIRSWLFYLLAGVAVGTLAVLAFVEFFNSFHLYSDLPDEKNSTGLQGLFGVGRFLVPAGAAAGILFWRVAGRHYD
jgi:magnesium-transporting ATPase (P-type)